MLHLARRLLVDYALVTIAGWQGKTVFFFRVSKSLDLYLAVYRGTTRYFHLYKTSLNNHPLRFVFGLICTNGDKLGSRLALTITSSSGFNARKGTGNASTDAFDSNLKLYTQTPKRINYK